MCLIIYLLYFVLWRIMNNVISVKCINYVKECNMINVRNTIYYILKLLLFKIFLLTSF